MLISLLSSCVSTPGSTASPDSPAAIPGATQASLATAEMTAFPSVTETPTVAPSPTFVSTELPEGLVVSYILNDELWVWKQNRATLLVQRENISDPLISDDGQWIVFQQRHNHADGSVSVREVWAIQSDGNELHRLIGSDDLMSLVGADNTRFISQIGWLPGRHELLFNTIERIEGPPEVWPVFDLFLLDLSGQATRLAEPGLGGQFVASPDGQDVAVASDKRIGMISLQSGQRRTLLEFKPLELGCECISIPKVVWDLQSQFVITSIPPHKLHYPEEYNGEPEKVWRLFVNGNAELVTQWKPLARVSGIKVDPTVRYFLYLQNSCPDAMGMVHVYDLITQTETPLFCAWELPRWVPDGEHLIYQWDGAWRLGSIVDTSAYGQPVDILNVPTDPDVIDSPDLLWINDEHFLLLLRSQDACTLSVATLSGVAAEIIRTQPDHCSRLDFSLSKQ